MGYPYCSWPGCWSNSEKCTWVESNSKIKARCFLNELCRVMQTDCDIKSLKAAVPFCLRWTCFFILYSWTVVTFLARDVHIQLQRCAWPLLLLRFTCFVLYPQNALLRIIKRNNNWWNRKTFNQLIFSYFAVSGSNFLREVTWHLVAICAYFVSGVVVLGMLLFFFLITKLLSALSCSHISCIQCLLVPLL